MNFITRIIFVVVLLVGSVAVFPNVSDANGAKSKATWLWSTDEIKKEETVKLLVDKKVTKLYLQINRDIKRETYSVFMKKMKENNIQVYALEGSSKWTNDRYDTLAKWLSGYHERYPAYPFAGIHLDIEPYLSDLWDQDEPTAIYHYQQLIDYAYDQSKRAGLKLELDIPFWFDGRNYNNAYGKGVLAEWLIKKVDGVTLMAYRDTADSIVKHSKDEIAYGNKYGKSVTVGVETKKSSEGNKVSFAEEGEQVMNKVLADVNKAFSKDKSYSGVAIHHLLSWKDMKK